MACEPVSSDVIVLPVIVSRTMMNGRVSECVCSRKLALAAFLAADETDASSPRNTDGPVERVAQPLAPGSHHQTPRGSAASIAMQSPRFPSPTAMGVAVAA